MPEVIRARQDGPQEHPASLYAARLLGEFSLLRSCYNCLRFRPFAEYRFEISDLQPIVAAVEQAVAIQFKEGESAWGRAYIYGCNEQGNECLALLHLAKDLHFDPNWVMLRLVGRATWIEQIEEHIIRIDPQPKLIHKELK